MGVIYSGQTITNTTLDGSTNDTLNQAVKNALITIGWSLQKDGSGDGIWRVRSAATPQNMQGDVWLWRGTSGTPVPSVLAGSSSLATTNNTSGNQEQSGQNLNVGAGYVYRLIANAYYFYLFRDVTPMTTDCFFFSVPFVPPNLVGLINSFILAWAGSSYSSFLSTLGNGGLFTGSANRNTASTFAYLNGQGATAQLMWNMYGVTSSAKPIWFDTSCEYYEPRMMAYQSSNGAAVGNQRACGYQWDALVINQAIPRGTTISYDGGTWYVLTEGTDPGLMIKIA